MFSHGFAESVGGGSSLVLRNQAEEVIRVLACVLSVESQRSSVAMLLGQMPDHGVIHFHRRLCLPILWKVRIEDSRRRQGGFDRPHFDPALLDFELHSVSLPHAQGAADTLRNGDLTFAGHSRDGFHTALL